MTKDEAVLLNKVADALSLLFKHGAIPQKHTYARKVVGASIKALREVAALEPKRG